MTVGEQRFQIEGLAAADEPYLVADVRFLDEPIGDGATARSLSERVSRRFLRYLEALQPALADDDGPEIEIEIEMQERAPEDADESAAALASSAAARGPDGDRREVLMAAARRLVTPDDPTALSYVLSGLVQVELPARQRLLEARDTETRLRRLDELLSREIRYLGSHLKPLVVDARGGESRRN